VLLAVCLLPAATRCAQAQTRLGPNAPVTYDNKYEIYGGLNYMNFKAGENLPKRMNLGGAEISGTYWLTNKWGLVAEYRGEAIVDAIGAEKIRGTRILIPRAQVAREVLAKLLRKQGASEVVVAPAYKTIAPTEAALNGLPYDLVAFTSSSTASNFVAIRGKPPPGTRAAAIGPITGATAEQLGFEVVVKPRDYTVPALVVAICNYFASQPPAR